MMKALISLLLVCALGAASAQITFKGTPVTARYLRVEHTDIFHLAEVEMMSGGKNVAPMGSATQSGTAAGGNAQRAIDGNTDGIWNHNSVSSTAQGVAGWWEVDLGKEVPVDVVRVWNRTDCCGERLKNAVLTMLDKSRKVVHQAVLEAEENPMEITFVEKVPPPVKMSEKSIPQRMLEIAPRFNQPSEDAAAVMPVGGGDLSAMLRYGSDLEIHLSKPDFYAVETHPYHNSPTIHSPGHVTLSFGIQPKDIKKFEQRIDLARGSVVLTLETGQGVVQAEAIGVMGQNSLLIAVNDSRRVPTVSASLSSWRAESQISADKGVLIEKEVSTRDERGNIPADPAKVDPGDRIFHLGCSTALAMVDEHGLMDRPSSVKSDATGSHVVTLSGAAPRKYWLIITSAVTYDGKPEEAASKILQTMQAADKATLWKEHLAWWSAFWETSFVDLYGRDADYLMRLWYVSYYNYACTSGPAHAPAKFNGGPGLIRRDDRSWGWGYWYQNTREIIWPMFASNHINFARDYLDFYDRGYMGSKQGTARQGKIGIRMWESAYPYKPGTPVTPKTLSTFDQAALDKAIGSHVMEECQSGYNARSMGQVAEQVQIMLDYAAYTGDADYLKKVAGPWLKEAALFYLSYMRLGDDGFYHMTPSDAIEMWWKVKDPMTDLCCVRFILWNVVNHGAAFGYEKELIAAAADRVAKLAPLPTGLWKRRAVKPEELPPGSPSYYREILDVIDRKVDIYAPAGDVLEDRIVHNQENPELYLVYPLALVDANSPKEDYERAVRTFKARKHPNTAGWSQCPVQAVRLRLPNAIDVVLDHARNHQRYPYGGWNSVAAALKDSTTGANDTPYFDSVGVNLTAVQEALMQSHTLTTSQKTDLLGGGPIVIAPAVRGDWAGRFRLRARGGFIVDAVFQPDRRIQSLAIDSERGGRLTVHNPFGTCRVTHAGKELLVTKDVLVSVATEAGGRYEFSPK